MVDSGAPHGQCVQRGLMKAPCALYCWLWVVLLMGAGSLLLLSTLQELSEPRPSPNTGSQSLIAPRWPIDKTDCSPQPPAPQSSPTVTRRHRKLLLKPQSLRRSAHHDLSAAQRSRRETLQNVCARYQPHTSPQHLTQRQVSRVYVEDQHRLLYCEVPKSGCSNWKRVLMVLSGKARSTADIPHDKAHYANKLRRLESYDRASIGERLVAYTKMLFVREPFIRLVSAFRDKFESPNSYYHPVFGRPIISRYRANATQAALRTGEGVTFREFVRYLLDVKRPVGMDIHWEPVAQLCSPCLMRYNFIGKFENLEKEANFLLRNIGAPRNLTFPDVKDRNPLAERTSAKITQEYFSQLNATERQKVYDFYYMDYLMFDYPKPFKDLY